jgi:Cd(II)/Pb(II)-responsive transcriptional regulator
MSRRFQIGELSQALKVPVETIRYYEREGLLPKPERSHGNYRLYAQETRARLQFILNCRTLDMTLDEVRQLLSLRDSPEQGCAEVNAVLDAHVTHVKDRMRALRQLDRELKQVRARCDSPGSSKDCGILRVLGDQGSGRLRNGDREAAHRCPKRRAV